MIGYQWDFSFITQYGDMLAKGIMITILYAAGTILAGLIIGVVCGLAMLGKSSIVRGITDVYVQIFRCTPLLVQVVWFYYALPVLLNINLPPWLAAGLGLSLYMGAFSAEIIRAGVMSIEKGQWQAGRALGMNKGQLMRRIILPQAIRRMVPPLVGQSVLQLKNTSLLSIIAMPDLMYTGSVMVSNTFRPLEVYTIVAIIYFIMLYPLQRVSKLMEARNDV